MSSWESQRGRAIARFYGAEICALGRTSRVAWLRDRIRQLETALKDEREQHRLVCEDCRNGDFCFNTLRTDPLRRCDQISWLKGVIESEEDDEKYAEQSRIKGRDYEHHVDGWCRYWQNLRHRRFCIANYACEQCGEKLPLDTHHLHYNTIGYEEITDIQALCRACHGKRHRIY